MEKEMEKEKNMMIYIANYYLKENIWMGKEMEKEKNLNFIMDI